MNAEWVWEPGAKGESGLWVGVGGHLEWAT